VICDNTGAPVTAEQARQIIAWQVGRLRGGPQAAPQPQDGGEGPSAGRNRAAPARRPPPSPA